MTEVEIDTEPQFHMARREALRVLDMVNDCIPTSLLASLSTNAFADEVSVQLFRPGNDVDPTVEDGANLAALLRFSADPEATPPTVGRMEWHYQWPGVIDGVPVRIVVLTSQEGAL